MSIKIDRRVSQVGKRGQRFYDMRIDGRGYPLKWHSEALNRSLVQIQPRLPIRNKGGSMEIKLYLKDSASAFVFKDVIDTYQEGGLFCVFTKDKIDKFPLQFIFKISQVGRCAGSSDVAGKERIQG